MSRGNIVAIIPSGVEGIIGGAELGAAVGGTVGVVLGAAAGALTASVDVTFKTHGGGTRTYRYTGSAALAILNGDDPAEYSGERIE